MKRIFLISALFVSLSVSAQYTPFNPDAVTSATQQASSKDAKHLRQILRRQSQPSL